ncbi:MAG: cyclic nucleotide-binding domain-containing protein [Kofleriaceae bacterium]
MARPALSLALVAAFSSMAVVFLVKTFADAVFLADYGVDYVPHFYVAQSLLMIGLSFGYSWAARGRLVIVLDGVILLALAATSIVGVFAGDSMTFWLALALITLSTLAQLAVWNAVTSVVSGRKSRTFLPRAGAAATAGAVVGSFAASGIVGLGGIEALAFTSAGLTLVTLALRIALQRAGNEWRRPAETKETPQAISTRRLVILLAAGVMVEALLSAFIDFGFKREVTDAMARETTLGVFFALYYGVTNVALLVTQLVAASYLLATRSLRSTLSLEPIALGTIAILWVIAPVLAVAAIARGTDNVMKFAVARPAQEVALTPLPEVARRRLKVILRGVLAPGGAALAGALLIAAAPVLAMGSVVVPVVCVVLAIGLWAIARATASHYLAASGSELGLRITPVDPEALLDRHTIAKLVELCGSADRMTAELGRDMLAQLAPSTAVLERYIGTGSAATRRAIYELLADRPSRACVSALRTAVAREDDSSGALEAGLLALGMHFDDSQLDRARRISDDVDADEALRLAAWGYLSRVGALDAEPLRHREILRGLIAADGVAAATVCEAAITRELAAGDEIDAIIAALAGESPEQRRQALLAAACLGRERGIALVIAALADRSAGDELAIRLRGEALQRVADHVLDPEAPARQRLRLFGSLRGNREPEVTELAIRLLSAEDLALRDQAVTILLARTTDHDVPRQAIEQALGAEMDRFEIYVRARPGYASNARESQMEVRGRSETSQPTAEQFFLDELERCAERSLGRLCALLAILGSPPAVFDAERALRAPTFQRRRQALDVLQEIVLGRQKTRLFELLELYLMPPPRQRAEARAAVIALDPWLARCATLETDPMAKRLWALRAAPLFDAITGDSLATLADRAGEVAFDPGHVVVREGEPGDALFVVMGGTVVVERGDQKVAELGPGAAFGELALLDGEPRQATVKTRTRVRLLRLPRATFDQALATHPEIGLGLVLGLVRWLRQNASQRETMRDSLV